MRRIAQEEMLWVMGSLGNITANSGSKKAVFVTAKGTVSESQKREVGDYNLL